MQYILHSQGSRSIPVIPNILLNLTEKRRSIDTWHAWKEGHLCAEYGCWWLKGVHGTKIWRVMGELRKVPQFRHWFKGLVALGLSYVLYCTVYCTYI